VCCSFVCIFAFLLRLLLLVSQNLPSATNKQSNPNQPHTTVAETMNFQAAATAFIVLLLATMMVQAAQPEVRL
jgi:hypothetical protein